MKKFLKRVILFFFTFDETKYLLSSKKNKTRLVESVKQLETEVLQPRELLD